MTAGPTHARSSGDAATLPATEPAHSGAARLTVIAFGSSSTEGVGASSPAATYPNRMQAELRTALAPLPVTVINRGIGGEDADDMMRRLPGIIAERPDMVVWQTGSNDPIRKVPLARFVAETRAGVRAMRQAGIAVILIEPQDCAVLRAIPEATRYRDAVRAIGEDLQVPVIRRWDLMHSWLKHGAVTQSELMFTDGLHMTDGGYALLAHAVAGEILALRNDAKPDRAGGAHPVAERPAPQRDAGP